jgi:SAM-dependent methyltransferase
VSAPALDSELIWHDVECGAYAADLPVWVELASQAGGPVLELGAGTGRVALALAGRGIDVAALDASQELLDALAARAAGAGVELETVRADARELDLGRRFAAILAPMQLVHLLGGEPGRAAALRAALAHLEPGAAFAAALVADEALVDGDGHELLPDVRELDGWICSSQPLDVSIRPDGIQIRRLRQLVSPDGRLTERTAAVWLDRLAPEDFEREGAAAGFDVRERVEVLPTADHVGSVICVLEAPR